MVCYKYRVDVIPSNDLAIKSVGWLNVRLLGPELSHRGIVRTIVNTQRKNKTRLYKICSQFNAIGGS